MGISDSTTNEQFTPAELALVKALFRRLLERGCHPITLYVASPDNASFAAFHPGFNSEEADIIAEHVELALSIAARRSTR